MWTIFFFLQKMKAAIRIVVTIALNECRHNLTILHVRRRFVISVKMSGWVDVYNFFPNIASEETTIKSTQIYSRGDGFEKREMEWTWITIEK